MVDVTRNDEVLASMNSESKFDLYHNNLNLDEFIDFNEILDCKFFTEDTFALKYSETNDLLFFNANVQSLASKFSSLLSFLDFLKIKKCMPDIFALEEVWKVQKEFYAINGYNFYCNTRSKGQGGGASLYIKDSYNSSVLKDESIFVENIFEAIALKVEIPNVKKFICVSLYRPNCHKTMSQAEQTRSFFIHLNELLQKLDKFRIPVYIFSDSNIDFMKIGSNAFSTELFQTMLEFGHFQLIGKCTRVTNNSYTLIDHIFSSDKLENMQSGVIIDTFSDHFITFCSLKDKSSKKNYAHEFLYKRNFNDQNKAILKDYLSSFTWNNVMESTCPNEAYAFFWGDFKHLFELSFPKKKVKVNKNKHPLNKFMTRGLLLSRKTKLKLARKSHKSEENKIRYRNYRNIYNSTVKTAKAIYFRKAIESANGNSKKIWQTINEACNKLSSSASVDKLDIDGNISNDKEKIANTFNSHFVGVGEKVSEFIPKSNANYRDFLPPPANNSLFLAPVTPGEMLEVILNMNKGETQDVNDIPFKILKHVALDLLKPLTHIYNLTLEKGIFPDLLKTSKVIPIFKSGSPLDANNYRDIAIIDSFSKIFEKLTCRRLLTFLYSNDFFDDNQFGFLKDRSTNHAIVKMINFISNSINRGDHVVGIFLDAMKAFNSVNHEILFGKLENAGIRGIALDWFKSYLSGRNQKVKVGEFWSNLENINISVLQGSILGVILFIVFINDLSRATDNALAVLFADDDSSFIAHNNLNELNRIANIELSKICTWFSANKLALHPMKSKCILFKSPYDNQVVNQPNFSLFMNMNDYNESDDNKIKTLKSIPNDEESSIKVLGILLDQNLNLNDHIKSLHAKLSRNLYSLRQVKNIFPTETLKLIYNANFQSHINYCSNILSICNKTTLDPIIKIQKKAIRVICKETYFAHTGPLFKKHEILPVEKQIEYSSLLFMHDYLSEKLSPSFMHTWIRNNHLQNNYVLRNENNLHIQPHRYEYLKRHPFLNFANLWNNLSQDLKEIESRQIFSRKLKEKLLL